MFPEEELCQLEEPLKRLITAAIEGGEDLSSLVDVQAFIERTLIQHGYVLRGDSWVKTVK